MDINLLNNLETLVITNIRVVGNAFTANVLGTLKTDAFVETNELCLAIEPHDAGLPPHLRFPQSAMKTPVADEQEDTKSPTKDDRRQTSPGQKAYLLNLAKSLSMEDFEVPYAAEDSDKLIKDLLAKLKLKNSG